MHSDTFFKFDFGSEGRYWAAAARTCRTSSSNHQTNLRASGREERRLLILTHSIWSDNRLLSWHHNNNHFNKAPFKAKCNPNVPSIMWLDHIGGWPELDHIMRSSSGSSHGRLRQINWRSCSRRPIQHQLTSFRLRSFQSPLMLLDVTSHTLTDLLLIGPVVSRHRPSPGVCVCASVRVCVCVRGSKDKVSVLAFPYLWRVSWLNAGPPLSIFIAPSFYFFLFLMSLRTWLAAIIS